MVEYRYQNYTFLKSEHQPRTHAGENGIAKKNQVFFGSENHLFKNANFGRPGDPVGH